MNKISSGLKINTAADNASGTVLMYIMKLAKDIPSQVLNIMATNSDIKK